MNVLTVEGWSFISVRHVAVWSHKTSLSFQNLFSLKKTRDGLCLPQTTSHEIALSQQLVSSGRSNGQRPIALIAGPLADVGDLGPSPNGSEDRVGLALDDIVIVHHQPNQPYLPRV